MRFFLTWAFANTHATNSEIDTPNPSHDGPVDTEVTVEVQANQRPDM